MERGRSSPLGATPASEGTNFSVFSKHAAGVELLLFDGVDDDAQAARVILLTRGDHYKHRADLTAYLEAVRRLLEVSDQEGWARNHHEASAAPRASVVSRRFLVAVGGEPR